MNNRSWLVVPEQDSRYRLTEALRSRDVFAGRDCGYVEQMRPFIREFSKPGDLVFDPFCGFATTLLAAELENRRGLGSEADASRAALADERLAHHDCKRQRVLVGSCLDLAPQLPKIDLILTSVPYFGCRWPNENARSQLYRSDSYAHYLETMRRIFAALKPHLVPGGFIICMAENVRLGAHFVPLAWDVARLLGDRYSMCDERILIYERDGVDVPSPATTTNRAHEYALIARNEARSICVDATTSILQSLLHEFPDGVVYGSFAAKLRFSSSDFPSDADVLIPYDLEQIARMAAWFEARDFRVLRWGSPTSSIVAGAAARDSYYLRAERLTNAGELIVIDLSFEPGDATWQAARQSMHVADGIAFATNERC